MRKILNRAFTLLILTGWLGLQATVVSHEYSNEHIESTGEHLCLTNIAHFDELIPQANLTDFFFVEFAIQDFTPQTVSLFYREQVSYHSPRAPPINHV